MNSKILIFGINGFLGSNLKNYFSSHTLISPTHQELDLLKQKDVFHFIEKNEPKIIIYAAGITKIDFAEKNKELTNKLNHIIPKKISHFAAENKSKFIYISTDAVFDGYKNKYLFSETDSPKAKSVYGLSKYKGETAVLSNNSSNSVVRLITLYGIDYTHQNFLTRVFADLKKKKPVVGIIDQIQNPLYVELAAQAIAFITNQQLNGIYHLGGLNYDSNYNFLNAFANNFNLDNSLIRKATYKEFFGNNITNRKKKSVLLCDKFVNVSSNTILKTTDSSLNYMYKLYTTSLSD